MSPINRTPAIQPGFYEPALADQPESKNTAHGASTPLSDRPPVPRLKKSASFAKLLQNSLSASRSSSNDERPKALRHTKSFADRLRNAAAALPGSSRKASLAPPVPTLPADPTSLRKKRSFVDIFSGLRTGKSDTENAKCVFDAATVVNFTNAQYQFLETIYTDISGNILNASLRKPPCVSHIVNKWERFQNGETDIVGYDGEGKTAFYEASQLEMTEDEYKALPAQKKMQFAFLNYKNDEALLSRAGYGKSYFIITKDKCMADGYIHYGDSRVDDFSSPAGSYRAYRARLEKDPYSVRLLNQKLKESDPHPPWIEVNLKNGVSLPEDIDKFVVSEEELAAISDYVQVESAKTILESNFPGKIEYKE